MTSYEDGPIIVCQLASGRLMTYNYVPVPAEGGCLYLPKAGTCARRRRATVPTVTP